MTWPAGAARVLTLPSGRRVRGRGLRVHPELGPDPELGFYLFSRPSAQEPPWEHRWVHWPDFRGPADPPRARRSIVEAWERSPSERVEVACMGGRGRSGTFLACLAVLDGLSATEAIAWVRSGLEPRAVETPWQRRFIERFAQEN